MSLNIPSLHHVVFCVRPENLQTARDFWVDLGYEFQSIELADIGLHVLLDWNRGIEIISPTSDQAPEFQHFLDTAGEGVYSVVVRTADMIAPIAVAAKYGVSVEYQQHRAEEGDYALDEARMSPLFGMPVTFLATDRP